MNSPELFSKAEVEEAYNASVKEYGLHENTLKHTFNTLISDRLDCHHAWFHGVKPDECQGMKGSCCCAHCCGCGG